MESLIVAETELLLESLLNELLVVKPEKLVVARSAVWSGPKCRSVSSVAGSVAGSSSLQFQQ